MAKKKFPTKDYKLNMVIYTKVLAYFKDMKNKSKKKVLYFLERDEESWLNDSTDPIEDQFKMYG